jgi:hypothetical protein
VTATPPPQSGTDSHEEQIESQAPRSRDQLDLLDSEAAEASRLVGASWDPESDDLEEDDADEADVSLRVDLEVAADGGVDVDPEDLDEADAGDDELLREDPLSEEDDDPEDSDRESIEPEKER